jgi:hypothetical protein
LVPDDPAIREALDALASAPAGSHVTAVGLVTRAEGTIEGTVESFDGSVAVIATEDGKREIPLNEIKDVVIHLTSEGPE